MAFRREYTPIKEVGQLAYAAGRGQRLQRQQAVLLRAQELAEERKARRELAEFNKQLQMDMQKQAQAWEVQKMALRSQADFARQEQKRQNDFQLQEQQRIQQAQELERKRKLIMDSDTLTAAEKERALVELVTGVRIPQPKILDPMEQFLAQTINELNNVGEAAEAGASGEPLLKRRTPAKSPYPEYPDAFFENGVWKVIRDGKKYRIEE
jgi:hypothetical protein